MGSGLRLPHYGFACWNAEAGYNELAEKQRNKLKEFLKHLWGAHANHDLVGDSCGGDPNGLGRLRGAPFLAIINGTLGWYEDSKAADAIAALKQSLASSANVRHDGKWVSMAARLLVPGDIVKLALGKNIPAECQVLAGKPIQVDQSAMTGESLPLTRREGNVAKMGSNVVAGEVDAVVTATGSETVFGEAAAMICFR